MKKLYMILCLCLFAPAIAWSANLKEKEKDEDEQAYTNFFLLDEDENEKAYTNFLNSLEGDEQAYTNFFRGLTTKRAKELVDNLEEEYKQAKKENRAVKKYRILS